jgi:hypothetical protein
MPSWKAGGYLLNWALLFCRVGIIHLGMSFLQKWKLLMKEVAKGKVEEKTKMVGQFAWEFKPLDSNPSDVGFI